MLGIWMCADDLGKSGFTYCGMAWSLLREMKLCSLLVAGAVHLL